jgi:hypothetical protein
MSRSLHHLRGAVLGLAFLGAMGFGATQAAARPQSGEKRLPPVCRTDQILCYCAGWVCLPRAGGPCPSPESCLARK